MDIILPKKRIIRRYNHLNYFPWNIDKYFRNQIVGGKYLGDRKKITKGNDGYMNIKCDHETRSEEWKLPPHDISILWRVNYDIFMAVKILFFLYEISWHSSKFIDTLIWKMVLFNIILLQIFNIEDRKKIEYIYKFIDFINVVKNVRKCSSQNYAIS